MVFTIVPYERMARDGRTPVFGAEDVREIIERYNPWYAVEDVFRAPESLPDPTWRLDAEYYRYGWVAIARGEAPPCRLT